MITTQIITLCACLYGLGYLAGAGNQLKKQEKHNQTKRAHQLKHKPINEQKKADMLGLIDYLETTPEYNTPSDNGKWLKRIITELTKQTETDTNQ